MSERTVYLSGQFVKESEAKVSVFDSGFIFGDSIYDSARTFKHRPFKLEQHIARLFRSAKAARIEIRESPQELIRIANDVIEINKPLLRDNDDYWIIISITNGGKNPSIADPTATPTVVISCWPIDFPRFARAYETGIRVVTPSVRQLPIGSLDPRIKHRSRMHFAMANREVQQIDRGAYTLLLDREGNITEFIGANFFMVNNGTLFTPGREILEGVTREAVFELAGNLGIPVVQKDLQLYEVFNAEEALYVNTTTCILPITQANGVKIADGRPGQITKRMIAAWSDLVGLDIVGQALSHVTEKS